MAAKRTKGIMGTGVTKKDMTIRYKVNKIAAGSTAVPMSSMKTINCIEKQKVPQRSRMSKSSKRLCTVELIHLLLCDKRTGNVSGTTVLQIYREK